MISLFKTTTTKFRAYLTFDRITSITNYCPSVKFTLTEDKDEYGRFIEFEIKNAFDVMNIFHAGVMHGLDVSHGRTSKQPVHISEPLKEIENQLQQSLNS